MKIALCMRRPHAQVL